MAPPLIWEWQPVRFIPGAPPAKSFCSDNTHMLDARWAKAREDAKSPTKKCKGCNKTFPRNTVHFQPYAYNADNLMRRCRGCEAVRLSQRHGLPGSSQRYRDVMRIGPEESALMREYRELIRNDPCALCGAPGEVFDHIDPLARGGEHSWRNQARLCNSCNCEKQAKPLLLFMLGRRADNGVQRISG